MAEINIWPGSSSFSPGDTPFGFYDDDAQFVTASDQVATWCAQRLGYPLTDVELQDINFYTCDWCLSLFPVISGYLECILRYYFIYF